MKFNKIFIVSLLILAILTIGAVSASDNVTSDDLSADVDDVGEVSAGEISDDDESLSADEDLKGNEEVIQSAENDEGADVVGAVDSSNEITDEKPVLASPDEDNNVLSSVPAKVKISYYKQTGKYANNKKIYFKVVDADTGNPIHCTDDDIEIEYAAAGDTDIIFVATDSNGIGVFKWPYPTMNKNGVFSMKISVESIWDDDEMDFIDVVSNEVTFKVNLEKGTTTQSLKIKPTKLTTTYKSGKYFKAKITNSKTKKAVKGVKVILKVYTNKKAKTVTLTSNSKGIVKYSSSKLKVGKHKVVLKIKKSDDYKGKSVSSYINVKKQSLKIKPTKLSTTYKSGKYFKAKIVNSKTKKAVKGVKVSLKVYTGKKAKTITLTSNSKGIVKYSSSKLNIGKHKVVVKIKKSKNYKGKSKKSSIKISKGVLKISAPKVTKVYKKAGKYKVTVKNKASGKPVKGIKVTMKVYTGKKAKKYTVRTNSKGQASFSTKSLSKSKHKVVVTVKGTSKFKKASKKGSVNIVKNRISTYIDRGSGVIFTYRYIAGQMIGGDGTFHLYGGGKELMNKKIKVYAGSEYLGTIKSGVSAFIPKQYGTITFKFAGSGQYKPCSYEAVLFTYTYTPPTYTPTYTPSYTPVYTPPVYTPTYY